MFAPNEITQTTEALERLPSDLEHQSAPSVKRQRVTSERNTDILSPLTTDTLSPLTLESPRAKVTGRQIAQLRKENRSLHAALEEQHAEMQKVLHEYAQSQLEFDQKMAVVHQGHQQDLAYYQTQLQELMDERNQLSEKLQALEERYQELQAPSQDTVQEEAMQETTEAAISSPETVPPLAQVVGKTVTSPVRQEEEKHLIEALYLKREVQRMAEFLEKEHRELQKEQQQLISFQLSVREQAKTRQRLLEKRVHAHQRVFSLLTSFALLAFFIILEFVCLALFQTPYNGLVALSILIPVVVCVLLRLALETPLSFLKFMYTSAPHRRPVKA